MRWRSPALLGIVACVLAAAAACSTSYAESSSGSPEAGAEGADGGGVEASADALAPSDAGADARCASPLRIGPGGEALTTFTQQQNNATLDVDGGAVHAAATLAANATAKAHLIRQFLTTTTSVVLDYDLAVTTTNVYAEVGCVLHFNITGNGAPPSTLYLFTSPNNHLQFGVADTDAGLTSTDVGLIPGGTVHVKLDVDFAKKPGFIVGTITLDKAVLPVDAPFTITPNTVTAACGLYYGNGRTAGGSVDVTVDGVSSTICP